MIDSACWLALLLFDSALAFSSPSAVGVAVFSTFSPSPQRAAFVPATNNNKQRYSKRPSSFTHYSSLHRGSLSLSSSSSPVRKSFSRSSTVQVAAAASMDTDEREFVDEPNASTDAVAADQPYWDPVHQIYVGGVIPDHNELVQEMIQAEGGVLRLFGYGSLCWNPGTGFLAHERVTSQPGRAKGYRRCWAQKSTDHRGRPRFPGIVCTLLTRAEVQSIRHGGSGGSSSSMAPEKKQDKEEEEEEIWTEGLLYEIPRDLVDDTLAELDFREKGGYARDIITVLEDATGDEHQALLYRGTRDNPAIWPRALLDLPYAAAVMSVADGPSGKNDVYLNQLDAFLKSAATNATKKSSSTDRLLEKFDDTVQLARMVKDFQEKNTLYFCFGCGSNQHNQLLLQGKNGHDSDSNVEDEDAHEMTEMVLCVDKHGDNNQKEDSCHRAKQVFAGGGHGAILTQGGDLYLFGWNESGQCGRSTSEDVDDKRSTMLSPMPVPRALSGVSGGVETCALGFNHSIVLEKGTGRVYTFGDNGKGQVDGNTTATASKKIHQPTTPAFLKDDFIMDVACGLFHSAAITRAGEVVLWGGNAGDSSRWSPPDDDARFTRVACGRKHTVLLDDLGRVWTIGKDNKYGQLGRETAKSNDNDNQQPRLVHGPWETDDFVVSEISCGWSHTVVLAKRKPNGNALDDDETSPSTTVYGWGRNDKGQLGTETTENVLVPIQLFKSFQSDAAQQKSSIQSITCGSEFTVVLTKDQQIWSCGWNEHGNLGVGKANQGDDEEEPTTSKDVLRLTKVVGAPIVNPPGYPEDAPVSVAAGGAHVLAMRTVGV